MDNQQIQTNQPQQVSAGTANSQVDQQALSLTHAIALQESSKDGKTPNYDANGTSGEKGAYQWMPGNFESDAKEAGLDPTDFSPANQDKVAYSWIKKQKDSGKQPAEIASEWNSGSPDNYENHKGTNAKGVKYDTPAYVQGVKKYYQQLVGGTQSSSQPQNYNPTPYSNPTSSSQSQFNIDTSGGPTQTQSASSGPTTAGGELLDLAKKAGNFLFPIVGDVKHDIEQGTFNGNGKTILQQGGDLALSALPFIPGLGEAGEAAKGAEIAGEGIADTSGKGLLDKFLGSSVGKGTVTGYGAGVASNLSQGQGLGQSFVPNVNTVGGAVLGGATPKIVEGLGSLAKSISGIDPGIANELSKMGSEANPKDAELMDQYNQAAKAHATYPAHTPSVENVAASNLDDAANKISASTKKAGQAVGEAKIASGGMPLQDASSVAQDFSKEIKSRYRLEIGSDEEGRITVTPSKGSLRQIDPNDVSRIKSIAQQLNVLGNGATVGQATDVLSNINDDLERSKGIYGKSISPVDQLFTKTASDLNAVVRNSAPDLASANDRLSHLKNLQGNVREIAGNKLQRGELLMKRLFSDNSQDSVDLFRKIKDETGIDLAKHAVLAKNAIDNYGSKADKSLLAQMIGGATEGKGTIFSTGLGIAKGIAKKTFANPERISKGLLQGSSNGILSNLLTKSAIEAGTRSGLK